MRPEYYQAAVVAISLLNGMLLGWLSLIVLVNAQRRTLWLLLTDGALSLGALFFLFQAAVAGTGFEQLVAGMYLQWPAGWLIGQVIVLAWYVSILWHCESLARGGRGVVRAGAAAQGAPGPGRGVLRRHRWWLAVTAAFFMLLAALALRAAPYPWLPGAPGSPAVQGPYLGPWPLVVLLYPLFIVLCPLLAADALLTVRPAGPLEQVAHRRARPWLLATSLWLFVTAALTGLLMLVTAGMATQGLDRSPSAFSTFVVGYDWLISSAVTLAVLSLGQAIVSYEIFIGRSLPREGLRSQWYGAILLAAAYSAAAAESAILQRVPFFGLIAATILVVTFYALYNWRASDERERALELLRPALEGPALVEALRPGAETEVSGAGAFTALCEQVLGARLAFLVSVGPLAGMAGPPLAYPAGREAPADLAAATAACSSPQVTLVALDPEAHCGALWALPLWAQRGLIGLLLLGEKRGVGLYGQEELALARAAAERLLDTMAWGRMAQRLMELQRQRLAESQVADRRTRRVVHDEVLPRLHAVMLSLGPLPAEQHATLVRELSDVHRELSELLRGLPASAEEALARQGLMEALRQWVREEMPEDFEEVAWEVPAEAERRLAGLPPLLAEVVYHAAREALRNAARHARGDDPRRPLRMHIAASAGEPPALTVEDDGVGVGARPPRTGGQGIGLHSTMLAVLGGEWVSEPAPNGGTRVTLVMPG